MTQIENYPTNRKTIFLRYLENMLLTNRLLSVNDVKNFRRNLVPELIVLMDAYEKDLHFENHEELTAMLTYWNCH